jgi:hypothetical protein
MPVPAAIIAGMPTVMLRPAEDGNLDALFDQMRDLESVRMAAFTPADPDDRAAWGRGIASRALELLLALVPVRPLHARVASANAGSRRVLGRAGFVVTGTERSFASGRNRVIEEMILRCD